MLIIFQKVKEDSAAGEKDGLGDEDDYNSDNEDPKAKKPLNSAGVEFTGNVLLPWMYPLSGCYQS